MKQIIVVGASGFGRELAQYALDSIDGCEGLRLKGFLDDDPLKGAELGTVFGVEVLGDTHTYAIEENDRFVIALGDPDLRKLLADRLAGRGAEFLQVIHPTAYVAPTATIGAGCIVGPFASVGSHALLADHVLLNLHSCAGHDTAIGAYSVISPYATATGGSTILEQVFLGTHAVVTPAKSVGPRSKVSAGAVVYHDVPEGSFATGNPAKTFRIGQPQH